MNDAQRGIAAYKATAQKSNQPKKRKGTKAASGGAEASRPPDGEGDEVSVEISKGGSNRAAKPSGAVRENDTPGTGHESAAATERLLKRETDNKGYRKVAKFLLILGKEEAAKILQHFSKEEIEEISREIAQIKKIDNAEAAQLLSEFGVADQKGHGFRVGSETARSMLTAAFGEGRAKQILGRVMPETRERPFRFLADLDHEQIELLLKNETIPTVSIILPHLPPQKASKVLQSLPPDLQRETIRRIAKLKKVDPDVIVRIEGVLKERIRTQGRVITEEIDGREALANILKYLDYSQEEKILDELAELDPELSQDVKDRLFTIEIVFNIEDADLQSILRDYDDEEIAVILKAKEPKIQERILANLSTRRQAMVKDEILRLGKMRKSDVDNATKDFVDYLVDLDDQGKITIHWNDQVAE